MTLEPPLRELDEIVERSAAALATLAGERLVVTGAAGFLGSYLCHTVARANDTVLERPCAIACVDSLVTGSLERLARLQGRPDCTFVDGTVDTLGSLDASYVVHAASIASPPIYRRLPFDTIRVNVLGTWHVLELAANEGCRSVLYLSSSEVYGDPEAEAIPTREDYAGRVSFTGPRACYDESKRLAETLCRLYFERRSVPVKVARPFNVYGPGLRLDDGRVIPDLLRQGLGGGPLVLHSDGTPTRSFCYVTDATVAFLELLASAHEGEAFNVGTPEEVSMRDVADIIAGLMSVRVVTLRPAEDARYLVDNPRRRCPDVSKLHGRTRWRSQVPLRDGLRRTVESYAGAQA